MSTITADAGRPVVLEESVAAKILRVVGKTPVHIFLVAIGLLWLVPTLGLLVVSILAPQSFTELGWWKIFAHPSALPLDSTRRRMVFIARPVDHDSLNHCSNAPP